jgi:hypothetical protein
LRFFLRFLVSYPCVAADFRTSAFGAGRIKYQHFKSEEDMAAGFTAEQCFLEKTGFDDVHVSSFIRRLLMILSARRKTSSIVASSRLSLSFRAFCSPPFFEKAFKAIVLADPIVAPKTQASPTVKA